MQSVNRKNLKQLTNKYNMIRYPGSKGINFVIQEI